MKTHLTRFEKLGLTLTLVALPSPNPEYGRRRLRTWDELDVADLADALACAAAVGSQDTGVKASDWADRKTPILVDISPDILEHIIAALGGTVQAAWADTLTRVRERLERVRDKTYELPHELRTAPALVSAGR